MGRRCTCFNAGTMFDWNRSQQYTERRTRHWRSTQPCRKDTKSSLSRIMFWIWRLYSWYCILDDLMWAARWQKGPQGIYKLRSPRPFYAATRRVKIFAISYIFNKIHLLWRRTAKILTRLRGCICSKVSFLSRWSILEKIPSKHSA